MVVEALCCSEHGVVVDHQCCARRRFAELLGIYRADPGDHTVACRVRNQFVRIATPPLSSDRERTVFRKRICVDEIGEVLASGSPALAMSLVDSC